MGKTRLDQRVLREGLADDLRQAQGLIMRGDVLVSDRPVTKPGAPVKEALRFAPKSGAGSARYVSRGGHKLKSALDALQLRVEGKRCVDVGASTGGFTDCLLQEGASAVTAIDVGYGLLADKLRGDSRVHVMERTNARHLKVEQLPYPSDFTVVDASFIGARALLPALVAIAASAGQILLMVKPQFELPREQVPAGGVVRELSARRAARDAVIEAAEGVGWRCVASVDSAVAGPKGNIETFVLLGREG